MGGALQKTTQPASTFGAFQTRAGTTSSNDYSEQEIQDWSCQTNQELQKQQGLDKVSAGHQVVTESFTHLFNQIWHPEDVPADWRCGVIVMLSKKGNLSDCNNWWGITMLSIPGKVFCSVLLQCLKTGVHNILREEQAGFWKGRSCSEQICTLCNIIEQCQEIGRRPS